MIINLSGHDISEEDIRNYVQRNRPDAIPYKALQCIAYDYLNKVMRKAQKFDKWPKDIKEMMYSKGVRQDKETGLPMFDDAGVTAWSARARLAEERLVQANHAMKYMTEGIINAVQRQDNADSISCTEGGEYCDSQSCDIFYEDIKKLV